MISTLTQHQNCQIIWQRSTRLNHRCYPIHHFPGASRSFQLGSQNAIADSNLRTGVNQSVAVQNQGIPIFKDTSPLLVFLFKRNPQRKASRKKILNPSITAPQKDKTVATVHIRHQ